MNIELGDVQAEMVFKLHEMMTKSHLIMKMGKRDSAKNYGK